MTQPRVEVVPGDRIFLSTVLKEDVPLLTRWFGDLEMTSYLGMAGGFKRLEEEQEWFDSLSKRDDYITFAIIVRETQQLIGTVALMHINHQRGTAELGIAIGDRTQWSKGYGTEAVRLTAEYGCFFVGLYNVSLWFTEMNQRGRRAYEKAGFREAGRLRKALVLGGERYDSVMMDVLRDELDLSRMRAMIGMLKERDHAEG